MNFITVDAKTRNVWLLVLFVFVLRFVFIINRDNSSLAIGAYGLYLVESLGYLLGSLIISFIASLIFRLVTGKFFKSRTIAYAALAIFVLAFIGEL
ncbi:hypothetical protein [Parabacteroides bouchesdurhonensis]|uniref:hypothetical protein n=1 Tax=Parabacteroides bouchesdurhonensis TaxID=1936995 RepID=UPI000C85CB45|nr:hypothetical protein [Parabacteroides bouchesdurhonensis]